MESKGLIPFEVEIFVGTPTCAALLLNLLDGIDYGNDDILLNLYIFAK
jgi:hypothetical protein